MAAVTQVRILVTAWTKHFLNVKSVLAVLNYHKAVLYRKKEAQFSDEAVSLEFSPLDDSTLQ